MNDPARSSTVDPSEVAKLSATTGEWWDTRGSFAPLHAMNPVRLAFIRERALAQFGIEPNTRAPFVGLRLLDIGCGGGLLCEPMARLGFAVTGVDASPRNVEAAQAHAEQGGLAIDYRVAASEDLIAGGETPFDVVLNMEVVEHVANPEEFLRDCIHLVAPRGFMIVSTLNRTLKSLALAKIGAEYILRWTPVGSHDWRRFVTPKELGAILAAAGCEVEGPFGVTFDPFTGRWSRSGDHQVNYLMTATRPPNGALRARAGQR
ncbi:MAG TPA: bifunctional 2-polyprenyl-6-hydroxyphenol methylase/3-demethylubiquinol 3-O-methyltransferase UbiG [Caulobacteraceae bacterium]